MRSKAFKAIGFLSLCVLMNVLIAWGMIVANGRTMPAGLPFHNPRLGENPIAFYVSDVRGVQWVNGCTRPGSLLGYHPEGIGVFTDSPWWPSEALSFGMEEWSTFGVSAGWPLRSLCAWRTSWFDWPPEEPDQATPRKADHYGIMIQDDPWPSRGHTTPVLLPLKPIWPAFIGNTLIYASALAITRHILLRAREFTRTRRDLCLRCAYPITGLDRCPECGTPAAGPIA